MQFLCLCFLYCILVFNNCSKRRSLTRSASFCVWVLTDPHCLLNMRLWQPVPDGSCQSLLRVHFPTLHFSISKDSSAFRDRQSFCVHFGTDCYRGDSHTKYVLHKRFNSVVSSLGHSDCKLLTETTWLLFVCGKSLNTYHLLKAVLPTEGGRVTQVAQKN